MRQRAQARIMKTMLLAAALSMSAAGAPIFAHSGSNMIKAPFCVNGKTIYVLMDFGDPAPSDREQDQTACHGPCVCTRKKPQLISS